jgi:uncharacterized protein YjiS (DUF1127 family)
MSMITERKANAAITAPNFFGAMTSRVTSYIKLTRAERQLASLDDRMLADIGLRRNDIQTMVWGR